MLPLFRNFTNGFEITIHTFLNVLATDKAFAASFFSRIWVKELLHNILPKFGACRFQLINLTFFNVFQIPSEVFKFSRTCLIIGKVLGLFGLKVEKGMNFFFSDSFAFLNFWGCFSSFVYTCFYNSFWVVLF